MPADRQRRWWTRGLSPFVVLAGSTTLGAGEATEKPPVPPYVAMDYGPTLSATLEVAPGQYAYRGLAVRLDPGEGGIARGRAFAVFDTGTLRWAAGWTGEGFVDWRGVAFDGEHNANPRIVGETAFLNPPGPGWADPETGRFDDRRIRGRDGRPYGPLPKGWGRWRGHYRHGDRVVLAYSVGDAEVLESPGIAEGPGPVVFTRDIEIGPHRRGLTMQVCGAGGGLAERLAIDGLAAVEGDGPAAREVAVVRTEGAIVAAGLAGASGGCRWDVSEGGQVRLAIPASEAGQRLALRVMRGRREDLAGFAGGLADGRPSTPLETLTRGGPTKWPGAIATSAAIGRDEGPFAVDELTLPRENPWKSWMRLGGFDFLPGGRGAAVCTWQGDVWIVEGLGDGMGPLSWRRVAAGLFQPLGLKVVDGRIYVLGRDQITRLRDRNGDGEADFYENFNDDAQVTEHFHEFAMDLQADASGDFYYAKAGRHALEAVVPQHGTLIRVARDGSRSEVLARGMRAPNGLLVEPDGTFVSTDQEGHWTPMNRINRLRPGGFYGYMMGYLAGPRDPADFEPPLCWVHREYDRSPSEPLRVASRRWGPLDGALLCLSYGTGRIWNVLEERVGGRSQGGIAQLPLPELPTGIQRGRFHPGDGQLYACGLVGWSSNQPRDGGFYRIRATGEPIRTPVGLSATKHGLILTFSTALDAPSATEPGRFGVRAWNYRRTADYGSADYRVSDGSPGRDLLEVTGAKRSADGRSVLIQVPGLVPCDQMEITYDLATADGAPLSGRILNTVHRLRDPASVDSTRFEGGIAPPPPPSAMAAKDLRPGLALTLRQDALGRADARPSRMLALHVDEGRAPSPFLARGPFSATFEGFVVAEASGTYQFHARGRGRLALLVNGRRVIDPEPLGEGRASRPATLRAGPNAVRAELESIPGGATSLRLEWSSESARVPRETIPPTALRSRPVPSAPDAYERRREGRTLFAERSCIRCHAAPEGVEIGAPSMPELGRDNPSLEGVGSRLRPEWLYRWLLDPARSRPQATMPRLFHDEPTGEDRRDAADLVAFLMGLTGPTRKGDVGVGGNAREGEVLYEDLGCLACHTLEPSGSGDPYDRISLDHVARKYRAGALEEFLRDPQRHYAWSRMPDFGLSTGEAGALAAFLSDRAKGDREAVPDLDRADARRGRAVFRERRCGHCHDRPDLGPESRGPRPASAFGKAGDSGCLAGSEDRAGAAPRFALGESERAALREFLRVANAADSLRQDAPAEFARRCFRRYDCAACHDRDGDGARRPAILIDEGVQGIPPERVPMLTWAGESLRAHWAERRIGGSLRDDERPRPWLKARMPKFPAVARALAGGLATEHGLAADADDPGPATDPARAEAGRTLATTRDGGLYCIQCHSAGPTKAVAPFENPGVDLALVPDRLRYEFFLAWMLDPQRFDPRTGMLTVAPDRETTAVRSVAGGDARAQFEALWQFFRSSRSDAPRGTE